MKIFLLPGSINDGGAETISRDYAISMKKKGHDIKIFAIYDLNTANNRILKENGIPVIYLFGRKNIFTRTIHKFLRDTIIINRLKNFIKKEKPNIIHVHSNWLHYLQRCYSVIGNAKVFYTCHSLPARYFSGNNQREYVAAQFFIEKNNLVFFALHEKMKQEIVQMFNYDNVMVVFNGIDTKKFLFVDMTPKEIRKEIGIPADAFVIGHIGRFSPEKNHIFLLEIFKKIKEKRSNSYLLLIGDGPIKNEIIEVVESCNLNNNVIILSHRTDIAYLLKAMDYFVFPSFFEGYPISVIEAQIANIPCLISNTICDEVMLSPNCQSADITADVELWVNKILCTEKQISKIDEKKYDINTIVDKVLGIYESKI